MLTVITPAASIALTTLTRARAILGFSNTDDAAAVVLIGQASRAIADYCRRPFGLETYRETFVDNDLCGSGPLLSRGPVTEITSVRSNSALLVATDYRLDAATGLFQRVDLDGRALPWWGGSLVVDYSAGFTLPSDATGAPAATLPASVERAATLILAAYLSTRRRDPLLKADSVEGIGSQSWWMPGTENRLPSPEAEQLLAPFRRFYP